MEDQFPAITRIDSKKKMCQNVDNKFKFYVAAIKLWKWLDDWFSKVFNVVECTGKKRVSL